MYLRSYSNLYTSYCPCVGLITTQREKFKTIVQGLKIKSLFTNLHHWPFILLLHWSPSNPLKERIAHFKTFSTSKAMAGNHLLIHPIPRPTRSYDSEAKLVIETICFCYSTQVCFLWHSWSLNTLTQCFEAKRPVMLQLAWGQQWFTWGNPSDWTLVDKQRAWIQIQYRWEIKKKI